MLTTHNVPYALKCIRHVLPDKPARADSETCSPSFLICSSQFSCEANLLHKKAGAFTGQAPARPGYRQILTRAAPTNDIHRGELRAVQLCNVSHMEHIRELMFCDFYGKDFDLTGPNWCDTVSDRSQREAADPIEEAAHSHHDIVMAGLPDSCCSFL